jgi:hypothetical protein
VEKVWANVDSGVCPEQWESNPYLAVSPEEKRRQMAFLLCDLKKVRRNAVSTGKPLSTCTMNPNSLTIARQMAAAVRQRNEEEFNLATQCAVAYLGTQAAAQVINRELPLLLDTAHIPTLLRWLVGGHSYEDTAQAFLAATVQVLLSSGITGFSYVTNEGGVPQLLVTPATMRWLEDEYDPAALKQASPYLQVGA